MQRSDYDRAVQAARELNERYPGINVSPQDILDDITKHKEEAFRKYIQELGGEISPDNIATFPEGFVFPDNDDDY